MEMSAKQVRGTVTMMVALLVAGCAAEDPQLTAALETITGESVAQHIQVLASDEFEGRGPSSPGEERTIAYLGTELEALGLRPGNGDSFFQQVPLVSITADPGARLTVSGRGAATGYAYGREFIAWTKRVVDRVTVRDAELVFVGYGTVAPEYDWNDYAGLDVRGKAVVILVNDPGFPTKDSALFSGNAMTYYGRWTYKFEEAARQGAAAAFVVHETGPAGYPWDVVEGSWGGEQFDLVHDDDNMSRVAVEGWLAVETARSVFARAALDYDSLKEQAATRQFAAVPLGVRAAIALRNQVRRSVSHNVLAVLPGTDRADEYVLYMAHWDHLGRDASLEGDQIYNGAKDNATGTAGLLAVAGAFAALEPAPRRSILFLAVTAEEQGLLGSAYYAAHPVYPLAKTVAAINMDGMNVLGPMRDVTVVGLGYSELDDYMTAAADAQGRSVRPDPEEEKGFYFRSDHFSFAKQGVPALNANAGIDHVEHGEQWTMERRAEYNEERYHTPSDEYDPAWDLAGLVDDLRLLFRVGYRLAADSDFPNWREGVPFRATRDSLLAAAQ
jgi:Zn-dependent M28 family amino/carboxypeptidase